MSANFDPNSFALNNSGFETNVQGIYDPATGSLRDFNGDNAWFGVPQKYRSDIINAYNTIMGQVDMATIDYSKAINQACIEASAAIETASVTAEAEMYKADQEFAAIKEQCMTDIEIARIEQETEKMKLDVEMKRINEVDAVNAAANTTVANAQYQEALAERDEAEGERTKDDAKAYDIINS